MASKSLLPVTGDKYSNHSSMVITNWSFLLKLDEKMQFLACAQQIYRIHSDRRSCPNRHSPPSSSSSWHTKISEINDFFVYKNCVDLRSVTIIIRPAKHSKITFSKIRLKSDFFSVRIWNFSVTLAPVSRSYLNHSLWHNGIVGLHSSLCRRQMLPF